MAVRGEDAGHFAQCSAPIFHVAQTEGNCHAIEGGIGKRQSHRISHDGSLHALLFASSNISARTSTATISAFGDFFRIATARSPVPVARSTMFSGVHLAMICAA